MWRLAGALCLATAAPPAELAIGERLAVESLAVALQSLANMKGAPDAHALAEAHSLTDGARDQRGVMRGLHLDR